MDLARGPDRGCHGRRTAARACNLIPAAPHSFPSTLGEVSRPFAGPGQVVTVRRPGNPVFAHDPSANRLTLRFLPPSGLPTTIDVPAFAPAEACPPDACDGILCDCVSFVFPDTDDRIGTPTDGHTLTGPDTLVVLAVLAAFRPAATPTLNGKEARAMKVRTAAPPT